jgi:hypothetical protein
MPDPLAQILQLVADGQLTAAEAAPILDALGALEGDEDGSTEEPGFGLDGKPAPRPEGEHATATSIRIEITERGRKIVNLRVPVSLGRMALDRIPGMTGNNADIVRRALAEGRSGTLVHIDEDGDGVRIALE